MRNTYSTTVTKLFFYILITRRCKTVLNFICDRYQDYNTDCIFNDLLKKSNLKLTLDQRGTLLLIREHLNALEQIPKENIQQNNTAYAYYFLLKIFKNTLLRKEEQEETFKNKLIANLNLLLICSGKESLSEKIDPDVFDNELTFKEPISLSQELQLYECFFNYCLSGNSYKNQNKPLSKEFGTLGKTLLLPNEFKENWHLKVTAMAAAYGPPKLLKYLTKQDNKNPGQENQAIKDLKNQIEELQVKIDKILKEDLTELYRREKTNPEIEKKRDEIKELKNCQEKLKEEKEYLNKFTLTNELRKKLLFIAIAAKNKENYLFLTKPEKAHALVSKIITQEILGIKNKTILEELKNADLMLDVPEPDVLFKTIADLEKLSFGKYEKYVVEHVLLNKNYFSEEKLIKIFNKKKFSSKCFFDHYLSSIYIMHLFQGPCHFSSNPFLLKNLSKKEVDALLSWVSEYFNFLKNEMAKKTDPSLKKHLISKTNEIKNRIFQARNYGVEYRKISFQYAPSNILVKFQEVIDKTNLTLPPLKNSINEKLNSDFFCNFLFYKFSNEKLCFETKDYAYCVKSLIDHIKSDALISLFRELAQKKEYRKIIDIFIFFSDNRAVHKISIPNGLSTKFDKLLTHYFQTNNITYSEKFFPCKFMSPTGKIFTRDKKHQYFMDFNNFLLDFLYQLFSHLEKIESFFYIFRDVFCTYSLWSSAKIYRKKPEIHPTDITLIILKHAGEALKKCLKIEYKNSLSNFCFEYNAGEKYTISDFLNQTRKEAIDFIFKENKIGYSFMESYFSTYKNALEIDEALIDSFFAQNKFSNKRDIPSFYYKIAKLCILYKKEEALIYLFKNLINLPDQYKTFKTFLKFFITDYDQQRKVSNLIVQIYNLTLQYYLFLYPTNIKTENLIEIEMGVSKIVASEKDSSFYFARLNDMTPVWRYSNEVLGMGLNHNSRKVSLVSLVSLADDFLIKLERFNKFLNNFNCKISSGIPGYYSPAKMISTFFFLKNISVFLESNDSNIQTYFDYVFKDTELPSNTTLKKADQLSTNKLGKRQRQNNTDQNNADPRPKKKEKKGCTLFTEKKEAQESNNNINLNNDSQKLAQDSNKKNSDSGNPEDWMDSVLTLDDFV